MSFHKYIQNAPQWQAILKFFEYYVALFVIQQKQIYDYITESFSYIDHAFHRLIGSSMNG